MSTFETLAEEAAKGGAQAGEDLERKIQEALACPCLDDVREGPCGPPFATAFACYVRKFKSEQLDDCYPVFEQLHRCMASNAEAFAAYYRSAAPEAEAKKPEAEAKKQG